METFFSLFLIVLASGGFALAFYIFTSKRKAKPMVCPLDGHCDEVTRSEYSKFFGVPVEIFGMIYYAAVAAGYGLFLAYPSLALPQMIVSLAALTAFSFLFSLYLTFIQAFNLRQWCTWCLISAGISSFIFLASFLTLKSGVLPIPAEFFEETNYIMLAGHILSAALGFGVAAVSGILFLKFAKDLNISKFEADVMHIFTQIIWFALFILVLSGFGLYAGGLVFDLTFFFRAITVILLMVSSAIFNLLAMPKLIKKSLKAQCGEGANCSPSEIRFSVALNAVSVFSWIFALIFATKL